MGKLSHLTQKQNKSGAEFVGPGKDSRQSQTRMFISHHGELDLGVWLPLILGTKPDEI